MGRLIIISNRLPFSLDREGDKVSLRQSSGGLVSAIKSYFENSSAQRGDLTGKMWIGVADFPQEDWELVDAESQDFSLEPIFVDKDVYDKYYNGFSNSVLWPLFHYFSSLAEYDNQYFEAYLQVNQFFAEKIIPILEPGDQVWIHDYQLMILPHLLRQKRPEATIGFFLHIPFPSYEIFRLMPTEWKKALLHGVMGADLIGFHTYDYVQHFLQSVKMLLGVDNYFHNLQYQDRFVRIDLFPIGIDYNKFNHMTTDPEVEAIRNTIRGNLGDKKLVFSVDRLDYTKGLMQRLNGFEYFL
ncbi:MAG TPA: trehalose-6-phosphate synthase, partial [Puia sp.]